MKHIKLTPEKKEGIVRAYNAAVPDREMRQKGIALAADGAQAMAEDGEGEEHDLYFLVLARYAMNPSEIDEDYKEAPPMSMIDSLNGESDYRHDSGVMVRRRGKRPAS